MEHILIVKEKFVHTKLYSKCRVIFVFLITDFYTYFNGFGVIMGVDIIDV